MWRRLLGNHEVPSADTMARVQALFDPEDLRDILAQQYARQKRNKALPAPPHGLIHLVLDGHESTASYRRCCPGCLTRQIHTSAGTRTQYYHRYVVALFAGDGVEFLLDEEPVRPGGDEVAAATRLLLRVHVRYPRAYDVVLADSLYARISFFRTVLSLGKHVQVVLKHDEWAINKDVRALCELVAPTEHVEGSTTRQCWDLGDLPWGDFEGVVRVVRSEETTPIRRQLTKEVEETKSSWRWILTMPESMAPTQAVVGFGHRRWAIENEGFNEGVQAWHMNHVYHHDPQAMEVMLLLMMVAYNLLHVFYDRDLKPAVRKRHTLKHIGSEIQADIYATASNSRAPP